MDGFRIMAGNVFPPAYNGDHFRMYSLMRPGAPGREEVTIWSIFLCSTLLLEALAYLGRAAGNTIQRLTERLQSNGVTDLARFRQRLAPIETLMNELDRQLPIPEEELQSLFGNLAGFPITPSALAVRRFSCSTL